MPAGGFPGKRSFNGEALEEKALRPFAPGKNFLLIYNLEGGTGVS